MKALLLAILLPCQAFCCTKCIDVVQRKIDEQVAQIARLDESYLISDELMIYMYGRVDAFYDVLYVMEIEGCCP